MASGYEQTFPYGASASAQDPSPDERAKITEQQMTDDERFSLLVSVMGTNPVLPIRDKRIPEGVAMSAGYTPGVPRLGATRLGIAALIYSMTNAVIFGARIITVHNMPGLRSNASTWIPVVVAASLVLRRPLPHG